MTSDYISKLLEILDEMLTETKTWRQMFIVVALLLSVSACTVIVALAYTIAVERQYFIQCVIGKQCTPYEVLTKP